MWSRHCNSITHISGWQKQNGCCTPGVLVSFLTNCFSLPFRILTELVWFVDFFISLCAKGRTVKMLEYRCVLTNTSTKENSFLNCNSMVISVLNLMVYVISTSIHVWWISSHLAGGNYLASEWLNCCMSRSNTISVYFADALKAAVHFWRIRGFRFQDKSGISGITVHWGVLKGSAKINLPPSGNWTHNTNHYWIRSLMLIQLIQPVISCQSQIVRPL